MEMIVKEEVSKEKFGIVGLVFRMDGLFIPILLSKTFGQFDGFFSIRLESFDGLLERYVHQMYIRTVLFLEKRLKYGILHIFDGQEAIVHQVFDFSHVAGVLMDAPLVSQPAGFEDLLGNVAQQVFIKLDVLLQLLDK